MNRIIFLGTGGGRGAIATQIRKTGGIYVELDKNKFVIDPGPGALVHAHSLGLESNKWDGILLSHYHIDHANDVNALLDGMENAFLIAEEHCLEKKSDIEFYPCVTKHHQEHTKNVYSVVPEMTVKVNGLKIETTKTLHNSPEVGFKISGSKVIGYTADGSYFNGLERYFEGCDILIMHVPIPKGGEPQARIHMNIDEAVKMVKKIIKKPELIVLRHFSPWIIRANLYRQARILQDMTGVKTLFAEDFMEINMDKMNNNSRFTRILKAND